MKLWSVLQKIGNFGWQLDNDDDDDDYGDSTWENTWSVIAFFPTAIEIKWKKNWILFICHTCWACTHSSLAKKKYMFIIEWILPVCREEIKVFNL